MPELHLTQMKSPILLSSYFTLLQCTVHSTRVVIDFVRTDLSSHLHFRNCAVAASEPPTNTCSVISASGQDRTKPAKRVLQASSYARAQMPPIDHRRNCRKIEFQLPNSTGRGRHGAPVPHQPKHRVEHAAMIARRTAAPIDQKRLKYAHSSSVISLQIKAPRKEQP